MHAVQYAFNARSYCVSRCSGFRLRGMTMKRYKSLLAVVALDERDTTTLRHAAFVAMAAQSDVVYLAHIAPSFDLPPKGSPLTPDFSSPIDEEILRNLAIMVDQQRGLFPSQMRLESVVREGSVPLELLRLGAQKSADLICFSRRLDETADPLSAAYVKIVRKAPCSVLVVPANAEPRYERILVAVDFSDPQSTETLDAAFAFASCCPGSAVTILHVYSVPAWYYKSGPFERRASGMKGLAEWEWGKMELGINFRDVPWKVHFILDDNVPQAISTFANEREAQLLVMGSHGRTRPAAMLLGHVTEAVCAQSKRSFFCVKRKGEVKTLLRAFLEILP